MHRTVRVDTVAMEYSIIAKVEGFLVRVVSSKQRSIEYISNYTIGNCT